MDSEATSSLTSKGQVTIPKALRQQLGLARGSRVSFHLVGDHIEVRPLEQVQAVSASGFGMLSSPRPPVPVHFDPATETQRQAARQLVESGQPLFLPKTVALELEWVLRGYYGFAAAEVLAVFDLLLDHPTLTLEDRPALRVGFRRCPPSRQLPPRVVVPR